MTTRQQINQILQILGLQGFDATTIRADNPTLALALLLSKRRIKLPDPARTFYELKRQALVEVDIQNGQTSFRLTPAGIHRLQKYRMGLLTLRLPKKWDRKWRAVAFDIPTKQSKERAAFVQRLRELGFSMLQKSLWVYPGECFDVVLELADFYNVARYCSLFELVRMDEPTSQRLLRNYRGMKI